MKLFKRQKRVKVESGAHDTYISIDIGTEFVKTALCRINKNRQVEVIGYDRTPQKQNAMRGSMIVNLKDVVNAVDISIGNSLSAAEKDFEGVKLPQGAVIGIGGELIKGVSIIVNYEREDPDFKIDQIEIDDVIEQIRGQAFESAREEISEELGIDTDQIVEIETTVNSTTIDGVKVDNPLGFKGKDIAYRIYATFAPKIHVDALQQVLDELQLNLVSMVVEPYAVAVGAKNARNEKFSGIFIDIGGGTTDLALVENGTIVGTNMFAFGGRVFTKRLELAKGLDYVAAEKLKLDYADKKLSDKASKEIKTIISGDLSVWADGVNIGLTEFEDVKTYPSQIYLCGGGTMLPDINETLIEYPWLKSLPFTKFPKVTYLFPNQINDVVDLTRSANDPRDVTPLALARILLDYIE